MSLGITATLDDRVGPKLAQLQGAVTPEQLGLVAGRATGNLLREHFFRLDRERPNRLGGRRTHFYGQAARSVQQPRVSPTETVVSINHVGVAQRYRGGTIRPVRARFLTIPARAEAHGKRAREFNLRFVVMPQGGPALVEADSTRVRFTKKGPKATGETGGLVMYWLKRSVTQKPDPTVLPSGPVIDKTVSDAAHQLLDREIARRAQ